jgi:hypothetical protein
MKLGGELLCSVDIRTLLRIRHYTYSLLSSPCIPEQRTEISNISRVYLVLSSDLIRTLIPQEISNDES